MPSLHVEIELLADAIFRESSATVGRPTSHAHIPGATLLGAAAAEFYKPWLKSNPTWPWLAFHSGKVRFGDALPLGPSGEPTVPQPASWARSKHPDQAGQQDRSLLAGDHDRWTVRLDGTHVTDQHRVVDVIRRTSLRTSVRPDGQVLEGHFFELQALQEGHRFLTRIDVDDDVPAGLVDALRARFNNTSLRLGASKQTEFGAARARLVEPREPALATKAPAGMIRLLAVSDLALRDPQTGERTTHPTAANLGLPAGLKLVPERSFLSTRQWSPFNAHRGRPDLERLVICAGSVLTFAGPADLSELRKRLARGVGDHRQDGLGRVLVEPAVLSAHPTTTVATALVSATPQAKPVGDPALLAWMEGRNTTRNLQRDAIEVSTDWVEQLKVYPPLPASQWGVLRQAALDASSREDLIARLFDEQRGLLTSGVALLPSRWGAKRRGQTRAEALRALLTEAAPEVACPATALLASRITRHHPGGAR
jgi:CRISPR-associated protein Csx10